MPLVVVEFVTVNGRPFGYWDPPCSICRRVPSRIPGWSLFESEVECIHAQEGGRRRRKRSGSRRPAAA